MILSLFFVSCCVVKCVEISVMLLLFVVWCNIVIDLFEISMGCIGMLVCLLLVLLSCSVRFGVLWLMNRMLCCVRLFGVCGWLV